MVSGDGGLINNFVMKIIRPEFKKNLVIQNILNVLQVKIKKIKSLKLLRD